MKSFFYSLIKGVLVTVIGTIVVYIIVFMVMTKKAPKNPKEIAALINEMVNVKTTLQKMNNKSADYLENMKLDHDFEKQSEYKEQINKRTKEILDNSEFEEAAKSIPDINLDRSKENPTPNNEVITNLRIDLIRMQKQLDRLENQNRILTLQVNQLLKDPKIQAPVTK